jgi:hypothetical protein
LLFFVITYSIGVELDELGHEHPSEWNFISSKAWEAIAYLKPFKTYTTSDGRLITTKFLPFSGDLSSELSVIHGINSYLIYTMQYLPDPHFPIIYKCIGVNYAFILLVRLYFFIFERIVFF